MFLDVTFFIECNANYPNHVCIWRLACSHNLGVSFLTCLPYITNKQIGEPISGSNQIRLDIVIFFSFFLLNPKYFSYIFHLSKKLRVMISLSSYLLQGNGSTIARLLLILCFLDISWCCLIIQLPVTDLRDDKQFFADHPGAVPIFPLPRYAKKYLLSLGRFVFIVALQGDRWYLQGEELRKLIGAAAYIECSSKTQQVLWFFFFSRPRD